MKTEGGVPQEEGGGCRCHSESDGGVSRENVRAEREI